LRTVLMDSDKRSAQIERLEVVEVDRRRRGGREAQDHTGDLAGTAEVSATARRYGVSRSTSGLDRSRRTASRCSGILPLMPRSISKRTSMRRRASAAIGGLSLFRQVEELPAAVAPTARLKDRCRLLIVPVKIIVPVEGVGLHQTDIAARWLGGCSPARLRE
jgi:hypothetical protein